MADLKGTLKMKDGSILYPATTSDKVIGAGYGTCSTAAATAAKVVTLSNYKLANNGTVAVKFTYAVPANATLNINSAGAKNIYYHGAKIVENIINAGDTATFMYDGTQYQLLSVDKINIAESVANSLSVGNGDTTISYNGSSAKSFLISDGLSIDSDGIIKIDTSNSDTTKAVATKSWVTNTAKAKSAGSADSATSANYLGSTSYVGTGLSLNTSTHVLSVDTTNAIATKQWVTDNFQEKCLMEGTQILMYDGSTKNVEDVKCGDSIMSYDPNTGENIEAIVIDCHLTGSEKDYTAFIWDDGSYVSLWGDHSIWREDTQCIVAIKDWQQGNSARKSSNELTKLISTETVRYPKRKKHYVLYSSNNLYYANGILMGHWSSTKYSIISSHSEWNFPQSILAQYESEADANKSRNEFFVTPGFLSKGTEILRDMRGISKQIDAKKKLLSDTDYSYTKAFEAFICALKSSISKYGVITLSAIKTAIDGIEDLDPTDRTTWRSFINTNEPLLAEKQTAYNDLRKSIVGEAKSLGQIFKESVTSGNTTLEAVRSWAKEQNKD